MEYIKLKQEIHELKTRINTLEANNELLGDRRLDELIKKLDETNKYERLQKENERLKIKLQEAREIIKEIKVK